MSTVERSLVKLPDIWVEPTLLEKLKAWAKDQHVPLDVFIRGELGGIAYEKQAFGRVVRRAELIVDERLARESREASA